MGTRFFAGAAVALSLMTTAAVAGPQYTDANNVALHGYDPVAYFTLGEPTRGSEAFTAEYNGATWQFASAEHRDLFQADPEAYAPAFDGHCAYGATVNAKVPGNPHYWHIIDDVLYVNVTSRADELFLEDVDGNLDQANHNWPGLDPNPAADPLQNVE